MGAQPDSDGAKRPAPELPPNQTSAQAPPLKWGGIAKSVLAVLLGGGSLFSVVQWAVKGPQFERQLEQLKVEQRKLDLEDQKMKREAVRKKNEFDAQAADLELIKSKMLFEKTIHDQEMESLRREFTTTKQGRNAGPDAAESMVVQIRESEQRYRETLGRYHLTVVAQPVGSLVLNTDSTRNNTR